MSYKNEIPRAGDWEETLVYQTFNEATGEWEDANINTFENYALVLFYESGDEIVRMAKNTVTADSSYKTWLKASDEVNGEYKMKVRREIVEALKGNARIYGIFYYQVASSDYADNVFRPATKVELGTTGASLTTTNLTT